MKRPLMTALLIAVVATAVAMGQATKIQSSGSLPANCTVGNIYLKTGSSAGFYLCLATDTWTYLAAVSDADKGDITVSSSGAAWAIDNDTVTNAKLADMASLTVKVRATNSSGDPSDVALTDGHAAKRVGTAITSGGFGPVSVQVLTSGSAATYTVPAGVYRIRVRLVGGGGGGGGADGGSSQSGAGSGGSSGAYAEKIYAVVPAQTFQYSVGALGAGGTAGNNSGSAGGATTFDELGSVVTAGGGTGGGSMAANTTQAKAASVSVPVATGGDLNIVGRRAMRGLRASGASAWGGTEGASGWFGDGGDAGLDAAGGAASGYGAGGGGAMSSTTTDRAGGDGTAGLIIVDEFN